MNIEAYDADSLSKKPPLQNQGFKWWEHVTFYIYDGNLEKQSAVFEINV
nr:hypothetical protein [uncultured Blautia sp.]